MCVLIKYIFRSERRFAKTISFKRGLKDTKKFWRSFPQSETQKAVRNPRFSNKSCSSSRLVCPRLKHNLPSFACSECKLRFVVIFRFKILSIAPLCTYFVCILLRIIQQPYVTGPYFVCRYSLNYSATLCYGALFFCLAKVISLLWVLAFRYKWP